MGGNGVGNGVAGVAQQAYEAFAQRDRDALVDLADPEVEVHLVTGQLTGPGGPYHGHDGIRAYLDDVEEAWDEIELQPRQFVELPEDRLLVVGRIRTRRGATHIDMPTAWLWSVSGSKVTSVRLLIDAESIASLLAARQRPQPA